MLERGARLGNDQRQLREGRACGEQAPEAERPMLGRLIQGELGGKQRVEGHFRGQGERNPGMGLGSSLPAHRRQAQKVLVLEMAGRIGGAVHTAETIPTVPGFHFDTCSVVHNLINMTSIPDELELREVGLEYIETDPFTVSFFPIGPVLASIDRSIGRARNSRAFRLTTPKLMPRSYAWPTRSPSCRSSCCTPLPIIAV
jgi:hypothetical protein